MVTIGWPMLLLLLIIGLRLGGVSLGLLSGLGLGVLTFFVQPAAPPNDLMLLQATWLLLMATLEATGFFYLLEAKLRSCLMQTHATYRWLIAPYCYGLVFLTGDKKWLDQLVCDPDGLHNTKPHLSVAAGIAAHMALLASPLSISGILLIVVAGHSGLAIPNLIGLMVTITASLTVASSLLVYLIPEPWLIKVYTWHKASAQDNVEVVFASAGKMHLAFLLVLLAEVLFLLIKPEVNRFTGLNGKIFPVRLPIFFALVLLSIAAIVMLGSKIKPAQILQTHRFKLGIQQFFIFLGLTWLLDSLISHDKTYLNTLLSGAEYGFYCIAALYMLLIDISIFIWLFTGLLVAQNCTHLTLALWLIGIHSLAPIRCWLSRIAQTKK
ncbi:Anaerobic C4-dicarboxylate transporter [Cardinium endosymbiont of Sogatella furcifera]|uniref:anaerobic C4-dicarboxylate transporter family protein n=1 Tax=Cardinium endosymbiont of Sogatella furcifera TaxID=650378 RepID=UPI000E0D034D|nr:anaerobic C4-dicarboxylate transporter family protein [Cardinium endosymbiont of Sogatella furcifera]AXI24282.1 Anaerobic C4-dicarboxylate transporter [Cardinium endosymbiont of Sogatella furcifera]